MLRPGVVGATRTWRTRNDHRHMNQGSSDVVSSPELLRVALIDPDLRAARVFAECLRFMEFEVKVFGSYVEAVAESGDFSLLALAIGVQIPGQQTRNGLADLLSSISRAAILYLMEDPQAGGLTFRRPPGSRDFVVKPFSYVEATLRLRTLARGIAHTNSSLEREVRCADLTLDLEFRDVVRAGNAIALTATEFRVLSLLILSAPRGLTKNQIANFAWPYGARVSDAMVEAHVVNLRRKLKLFGSDPIRTVLRGGGYELSQ